MNHGSPCSRPAPTVDRRKGPGATRRFTPHNIAQRNIAIGNGWLCWPSPANWPDRTHQRAPPARKLAVRFRISQVGRLARLLPTAARAAPTPASRRLPDGTATRCGRKSYICICIYIYICIQGTHKFSAVCGLCAPLLVDYVRIMCADYVRTFCADYVRNYVRDFCVCMCGGFA